MSRPAQTNTSPFVSAFWGSFTSMLRWPQLDELWQALRAQNSKAWFVYAVGEAPPTSPANNEQLSHFIDEIDALLRREHDKSYCGIVYVDQPADPAFIKIYDPNNLGMVCGSSGGPPPYPGWILSLIPPENLDDALLPPGNRRRWWQRLFNPKK